MMGDENETRRTPLHDDEERGSPVAAEAIPLTDGAALQNTTPGLARLQDGTVVAEATPLMGGPMPQHTTPGLAQRQKTQILSLSDGGEGKEEESRDRTRHELGSADVCRVLVYAQWIWPSMVFAGLTRAYSDEERWFASMVGNALFLACLWWIKTGAATATADEEKKSRRPHQHFVRTDVLPTVVWGILPPLSSFLSYNSEAIFLLALAVLLPLSVLLLQRCKRHGCESTMESFCNCCSRCFDRATAPFERSVPFKLVFKRIEEDYFEDLRSREDEESKKLEAQQQRLSYLEDIRLRRKDPLLTQHRGLFTVALIVPIVLSVLSVCFLIYAQLFLIAPAASALEYKWPEIKSNEFALENVRRLTQHNWHAAVRRDSAVFINFCAPRAAMCGRLEPIWARFAEEGRQMGMPLTVAVVNCVEENELCKRERVMVFPTLRWYQNGKAIASDYKFDRNVRDLVNYSNGKLFPDVFPRTILSGPEHDSQTADDQSKPTRLKPIKAGGQSITGSLVVEGPLESPEDSVEVKVLDQHNWHVVVRGDSAVFINFCAPWAVHCKSLEPTWAKFAREAREMDMALTVAVVNCLKESELCQRESVRAFPTLRWYQNGEGVDPDYNLDRTLKNFLAYSGGKLLPDLFPDVTSSERLPGSPTIIHSRDDPQSANDPSEPTRHEPIGVSGMSDPLESRDEPINELLATD